ncbi:hypothetical protein ABF87_11620 [Nitrosomonas sp. JL21]|uniref:hypothetical protein n=1 Tax=Nitrosomonas sp. JL21 TaxID=153949 RepID=UPI00136C5CD8|nr:hypothetical protein [Nitrosomonas sp. JL21]MBL8496961.1 hypothetical protein [Nitrosomonas sp.]MCC7091846.1 hypothetical protein [Nitrosomonas sp.]MXS78591.1 hypothetical protein [Nitrosomonas sp. JL21]
MSKILRWVLQFSLLVMIAITFLILCDFIVKGGTVKDYILFLSGLVLFSGLLWLSKFIGDPALNSEEWKAKFNSPENPLWRWYKPVMAGLILINIITNLISGSSSSVS